MTDKQILKKAIRKAVQNGYDPAWWLCEFNVVHPKDNGLYFNKNTNLNEAQKNLKWHNETFTKDRPAKLGVFPKMEYYFQVIFSHNFAKGFWGDIQINEEDGKGRIISYFIFADVNDKVRYDWEAHLQQMVLEKDKLKYLEKFLDEN